LGKRFWWLARLGLTGICTLRKGIISLGKKGNFGGWAKFGWYFTLWFKGKLPLGNLKGGELGRNLASKRGRGYRV